MFVVVAVALLGAVFAWLPILTGVMRVRVPAVVWFGIGSVSLLVGILGAILGVRQALEALGMASGPLHDFAAAGLAMALCPLDLGAMASAYLLASLGFSVGLGCLFGKVEERRSTGLHALPCALLVPLVLVLAAGGAVHPLAIVGIAGLGLLLASLVFSDAPEEAARIAAARVTAGSLGVAALGALAVQIGAHVPIRVRALWGMDAGRERVQRMVDAIAWAETAELHVLVAAVAFVFVTAVSAGVVARHLLVRRTLLGAGLVVLFCGGVAGGLGRVASRASVLEAMTDNPSLVRLDLLDARGVRLPASPNALRWWVSRQTLTLGPDGATLDDLPVTPDALSPDSRVNLELDVGTRLGDLRPYAPKLERAQLDWVVTQGGELRVLSIDIAPGPAGETVRFEAVLQGSTWQVGAADEWEPVLLQETAEADLIPALAVWRQQYPAVDSVHVWMPDDTPVGELIGLAESGLGLFFEEDLRVVWRIDPPPQWRR